jgi:uncharacterized protein with HEPN domain
MSSDSYVDYLNDILQAIDKAQQFTSNISYEEFKRDEKTQYAVIRTLEIIGEASNNIPKNVRNNHPYIPWGEMKGMRNKLIHDYMGVNTKVVWNTVQEDLVTLETLIEKMKNQPGPTSGSA